MEAIDHLGTRKRQRSIIRKDVVCVQVLASVISSDNTESTHTTFHLNLATVCIIILDFLTWLVNPTIIKFRCLGNVIKVTWSIERRLAVNG